MAKFEFRLSAKADKQTDRYEILLRLTDSHLNLRAKTSIFVSEKNFRFLINRKASEKMGHRVPSDKNFATKDEAEKKGYVIYDRGEIFIKERLETESKRHDTESKNRLDDLSKYISESLEHCDKSTLTSSWLKSLINTFNHPEAHKLEDENSVSKDIFSLGGEFLKMKESSCAESTIKHFKGMFRKMARYGAFVRFLNKEPQKEVWAFENINADLIEDFRNYLRNEENLMKEYPKIFERLLKDYPAEINMIHQTPKIGNRCDNTTNKVLKMMMTYFLWLAKTKKVISFSQLNEISIPSERYEFEPICLTKSERDMIANFDLSDKPALERQRDIFIFQCLVGCRVSDLECLTSSNIVMSYDGEGNKINVLTYQPIKTQGKTSAKPRIPLNDSAISLIEKYHGVDGKGRLFPCISDQKYNKAIKKFMRLINESNGLLSRMVVINDRGESKPLYEAASSHLARRTFVNLAYQLERDPSIVCEMSGHVANSKAFARYRKINDSTTSKTIAQMEIKPESKEKQITASALSINEVLSVIQTSGINATEKAKIIKSLMSGNSAINNQNAML